ncbi:MAG: GDSL-like Lipase/Acylhydrolase [Akkermansiaceae bacterium]|nr:GDSL-like Lipase/Acylhydrolase [Akkermansiaceae bacterium]
MKKIHYLPLLWAFALGQSATAAITLTTTEHRDGGDSPGVPITVSGTDLVNAGQPTLGSVSSSDFTAYGDASIAVLNDGLDGGWNSISSNTAVTTQTTPWALTYMLNLAGAPNGYDISRIDVMSLWTIDYVNQHYSVLISTTSNPAFTVLDANVTTTTASSQSGAGSSLLSSLTDNSPSGVIASNVTGIQFVFEAVPDPTSAGEEHQAAYREVDVFGVSSIPEPAAGTLSLIGLGVILRRRRH